MTSFRSLFFRKRRQKLDKEKADTDVKEETPDPQTSSSLTPSEPPPPARETPEEHPTVLLSNTAPQDSLRNLKDPSAHHLEPSPCSSGESGLPEPGAPCNESSVSCLEAISSGTPSTTAELAVTSKIPHRGMAPPASTCNKARPALYHNKYRPKHVRGRLVYGPTRWEARKQIQSQGILESKNEMKRRVRKTNFQESMVAVTAATNSIPRDPTPFPHPSTADPPSSQSEEEDANCKDNLPSLWRAPQSSSGSSHCPHSQQSFTSSLSVSPILAGPSVNSDSHILNPPLEHTSQPHDTPLAATADSDNRDCGALSQHNLMSQSSGRSETRPHWTGSPPHPLVSSEEDAVQLAPSVPDTLQPEACDPSTFAQPENGDVAAFSDDKEEEDTGECQGAEGGAAAAQNTQSAESVCRPKRRLLGKFSSEDEDNQCRICHSSNASPTNPLLTPCQCSGTLQFIHLKCLKTWIDTKINSGLRLHNVSKCELCMGKLTLNPETFNLIDYYFRFRELTQMVVHDPRLVTDFSPVPGVRLSAMHPLLRELRERAASSPHAGPSQDAGLLPDPGLLPDAGLLPDVGLLPDAGPSPDAGLLPDAGPSPDAGPLPDVGPSPRAGLSPESSGEGHGGTSPSGPF